MNIALWIIQTLMAVLFFQHGLMLYNPPESFPKNREKGMSYIRELNPNFRRFIGITEVLGGLALVLPAATSILPWLTPLAAAGLAFTMLAAIVYHLARKEYPNIAFNFILFALTGFIAYMRYFDYPF